jgi:DNA polymerase V
MKKGRECGRGAVFEPAESVQLKETVDQINRHFPKAIRLAAAGVEPSWRPKAERMSRRYTTDWEELVIVKC